MAHIKLDSPMGSSGMTNDLFKLMDGGRSPCSNEKKGLFSSFWKKPKLGKRAIKNEFEHQALDGPSYSAESESTHTETHSGEPGDAWNVESRDDDEMWGFDTTKTTRPEVKSKDGGFPPLPPSKANGSSSKIGSWDSTSHSRHPNPKVMVNRSTKKKEASQRQKEFSLTQLISQSFDSEAAEDMISINNQNFSFSEPPTEYTQLGLSGEATKLIRQDDGYQEFSASIKSMEVDEREIETREIETEETREIKTQDASLTEKSESGKHPSPKVEIDSNIPSFKDRLAYYKTRSSASTVANSNADGGGKIESPTFKAGHFKSAINDAENNLVKARDQNEAPIERSPDQHDSSVKDRIVKLQTGFKAKSTFLGTGRGELVSSSHTLTVPKSTYIHPQKKTSSPDQRNAWSEDRRLSTSSGHSKDVNKKSSAGVERAKNFFRPVLLDRSRSVDDPTVKITTTLELSSIPTVAQRKASLLSASSFDSSDNGSQHKDERLSFSKSLRLSDTSKEMIAIEGKTTSGKWISIISQKSERPNEESMTAGKEKTAYKNSLLSKRNSEAQRGKGYELRNSIDSTDQTVLTNMLQPPTRLSPTNLYKQSIVNLKPRSKSFSTASQNRENAPVSEFQKIKMQLESKSTKPESLLFKSHVPERTTEPFRLPKPSTGESKLKAKGCTDTTVVFNPESSETVLSIADRKKAFMCSLLLEPTESREVLLTQHSSKESTGIVPKATTISQANPSSRSEDKSPQNSQYPAVDVGLLSLADRMKAFGCQVSQAAYKGSKTSTSVAQSSNTVMDESTIKRPSTAFQAKNDLTTCIRGSLSSLTDREKRSFQKPLNATYTNENSTARRSVSTPRNVMYAYPLRSSTGTLNEIHLANRRRPAQEKPELASKNSSIDAGTTGGPESHPPKATFKSLVERQSVVGSTYASRRISCVVEASISSQQEKDLKPQTKARSHTSALDMVKSVCPTHAQCLPGGHDAIGDLSAQADPDTGRQCADAFTSTLRYFKKRSSSSLLQDKRPIVEDPSVTSTKVGESQQVFAQGDHPLYVIVDSSCNGSECLTPSPKMLERKIVCEPGEGMPYYEGLYLNNDDHHAVSPTTDEDPESSNNPVTLVSPACSKRPSAQEKPNTVERYQYVKSRFTQKTLPWRQQNAAGRYLERKRHTICGDSPAQAEHLCTVKLPRNSEMICSILKSPVPGSVHTATPTKGVFSASVQSPFGTPINGYSYGNNSTPL